MYKFRSKGANTHDSKEIKWKEIEIEKLRHELTNRKPGDSMEFLDGKVTFPNKLKVGLFGTTGIGKTSLINSLKFAFKGELTDSMVIQTSTVIFQGDHTVRRLEVGITRYLTFCDNRGAKDLNTVDAANEIIMQFGNLLIDWLIVI